MADDLRTRIAAVLASIDVVLDGDNLNATSAWLLADAVIAELNLREEWANEESLMLGIVKRTRTSDAIAYRIGSPWQEIDCGTEEKG